MPGRAERASERTSARASARTSAPTSVRVTLSGVRSVTHLLYAASYLRDLARRLPADVPVEVGVLDTGTHLGRPRVSDADVAAYLPRGDTISVQTEVTPEHWRVARSRERVLLSIGAPGLRALSRMVTSGWAARPRIVVVDEGIGSYGDARTRLAAYRRAGGRGAWPVVRANAVAGAHRLLTDVHWSLYRETADGWVVVPEVAEEFRSRVAGPVPGVRTAVYLTQPWPEVGVLTSEAYAAHLGAVRDACGGAGLGLLLRPHPHEDVSHYRGFDVLGSTAPVELDRAVIGASAVIGSNSTALLNLRALHGSRAVRVTAAEFGPLEAALGARQRSLLDAFLPAPVGIMGLTEALARP